MDDDASGLSVMPAESAAPTGDSKPTRAEGLWFDDCGLIIQAEQTIFRVSREFLAVRSPIFAGMLSMPTPKDAATMYGCPFVHLPDSAEDIAHFLKALIYAEFFEPYPAVTTLAVISSVLRMSHKYEVDVLRKRALIHLSAIYPTTLTEYDRMADDSCPWFPNASSQYFTVIMLARQVSALWLLPSAFYRTCNKIHTEAIIGGGRFSSLSTPDKIACVMGVRVLETTCASQALSFLSDPLQIPGCALAGCTKSRLQCRFDAEDWRAVSPREATGLPYLPLELWGTEDWDRLQVCDHCLTLMKTSQLEARQSIWEQLPAIFGLPSWTELEKLKVEALK
ncbi:hypothetical protein C8R43DRAFT_1053405 [Mycena crocata]|nr:hypothetical protein C8R43DRAFT_1053405 [Mycena crocata]